MIIAFKGAHKSEREMHCTQNISYITNILALHIDESEVTGLADLSLQVNLTV